MRKAAAALLILLGGASAAQAGDEAKKPPYWASIKAGAARMRTGPGRTYPVDWLYQRADLPVRVIEVYQGWRKIQDPDGEQGWVLVNLLSDRRTGFVKGTDAVMRVSPDPAARAAWKLAPGVVGALSDCARGWCALNVGGREGYIAVSDLWGVDPGEEVK